MRRLIGTRDYLHSRTLTLDPTGDTPTPAATLAMPLCTMFRVVLVDPDETGSVLFRGLDDTASHEPDPGDTAEIAAADCWSLDAERPDSGWIDAQVNGVRLRAVTAEAVVEVHWTARYRPTRAA
jgi:hypothetical protein